MEKMKKSEKNLFLFTSLPIIHKNWPKLSLQDWEQNLFFISLILWIFGLSWGQNRKKQEKVDMDLRSMARNPVNNCQGGR